MTCKIPFYTFANSDDRIEKDKKELRKDIVDEN
jgi:hypothetical protein